MWFLKYVYSINPWIVLGIFVLCIILLTCSDNIRSEKLYTSTTLGGYAGILLCCIWLGSISYYRPAATVAVDKAVEMSTSTKYASVKKYKVKSYLLTPSKTGLGIKAQVLLANGKKINDVEVKWDEHLATKKSKSIAFYDANLKPEYQPLNKDKFRKKVLVITESSKGDVVKEEKK